MELGHCNGESPKAKSVAILVPSLEPDNDYWCPGCEQYKSMNNFYPDAGRYPGITSTCKECDNKGRTARFRRARKAKA